MSNIEEVLKSLPELEQSIDTLDKQIYYLFRIAGKLGLYDAGDVLYKAHLELLKTD